MVCQVRVSAKINGRVAESVTKPLSILPVAPFTFAPADLRKLLCAYQSGFLVFHDKLPGVWKDRAICYDPANVGPGLLPLFTYGQVNECVDTLEARTIVRQGTQQPGWYWYALRVWTLFADPLHPENEARPEVREKDKVRAIIAITQLLSRFL